MTTDRTNLPFSHGAQVHVSGHPVPEPPQMNVLSAGLAESVLYI